MQIRIEFTDKEEKEIIIRCMREDKEVKQIVNWLNSKQIRIAGVADGETHLFLPSEIYYFESVDTNVYAYTKKQVYNVSYSLERLEHLLQMQSFFRCSKKMIVNMNKIDKFKSSIGNRITATLDNGEDIIISRHYAKMLRTYLKEVNQDGTV